MDIKALLGKKTKIDPMEKEAKLGAIKDMRKMAGDMMTDGIKGKMQKVTVAAPDEESLEMGLDKAKEIVGESEEMSEESDMSEMDEMLEECDTPEKIDEMIKKLAEKKQALVGE